MSSLYFVFAGRGVVGTGLNDGLGNWFWATVVVVGWFRTGFGGGG